MIKNEFLFGVSPSFTVSEYGKNFTVNDICSSMITISKLGFKCFQPEVKFESALQDWVEGGAKKVKSLSDELGLEVSQFIAHYAMDYFADEDSLFSDNGIEETKKIVDLVLELKPCKIITIPIGSFNYGKSKRLGMVDSYRERLTEKLYGILKVIEQANLKLAIEILLNSFIEGYDGFLDIANQIGSKNIGVNFDTGHAWANKEDVVLIPLKMKDLIFGTHLCDNFGGESLSLTPGKGNIPWEPLIHNLVIFGYKGSMDLEISTEPDMIGAEYREGRDYINLMLSK